MKKRKVTNYLGLNFEIDDLNYCLEYSQPDELLLDKIIKSIAEFKDEVYSKVGPDAYFGIWEERFIEEEKVLKKIYKKINPLTKEQIHKEVFDGSLLPLLSNNFKLIIYFEMKIFSHYLIHSKKEKAYYYVTNKRKWNKKNNKPIHKLLESYVASIFEKRPSKSEFFRAILLENEYRENDFMEKNKSIEYEKREKLWEKIAYISSTGLDYISLYKGVYERYLEDQYS